MNPASEGSAVATNRLRISALRGAFLWLAAAAWFRPGPADAKWGVLLLLLAALVIVPLGLQLVAKSEPENEPLEMWEGLSRLALSCGIALAASFALNPGLGAGLLALPWLGLTLLSFVTGAARFLTRAERTPSSWCADLGLMYLAVGGLWVVLSRLGARPLGFEPVIVLLTAMHFHYAGFALPVLAGMALGAARREPRPLGGGSAGTSTGSVTALPSREPRPPTATAIAVCAGVPAVAVGITVSQVTGSHWLETLAAWFLAAAGMGVALLYGRLAFENSHGVWPVLLRGVCAVSLSFAMVFAALYGSRHAFSLEWLTIPWMRALHGTAVAFGFALAGMLSWTISQTGPNEALNDPS